MKKLIAKIEAGFKQLGYYLYDHRIPVILITLVIFGAITTQLPKLRVDTSNEAFLSPDDPIITQYDAFREQYGRDEVVLIAIQPKNVFDKDFLLKLKALHDDLENEVPHLDEVMSLVNATSIRGEADELIVEELLENWPEDDEAIAKLKEDVINNKFYKNLLISEDGTLTTMIVRSNAFAIDDSMQEDENLSDDMFDEPGLEELGSDDESTNAASQEKPARLSDKQNTEFVDVVQKIVARHKSDSFPTYVAGSPAMTYILKDEMLTNMPRFTVVALSLIAVLLMILFRNIAGVIVPLLTVMMTLLSTVGLMAATNTPLTVITQILPSLILAVGVGYSVHLLAIYFIEVYKTGDKREAIAFSMGHSGLAILMTSLTTAGGLLSFAPAPIPPVATLGLFGSIGVIIAVLYTLIFVPAVLAILPINKKKIVDNDQKGLIDRILEGFGNFAVERPWTVVIVSAMLALISLGGISQLRFSHDVIAWLQEDNPVRVATEVVDQNLKGATTVEIVIDTGKVNGVKAPEFMSRLNQFNEYAEQWSNDDLYVGKSTSISDTLKQIHQALNENQESYYVIPDDSELIAQELILFENSGSDDLEKLVDSQFSQARITVKSPWTDAGKYSNMIQHLEEKANEIFVDSKGVMVTGFIPMMNRTVNLVMWSTVVSYSIAALVITLMMIFLLASIKMGLWSMIPNFLPILMGLGLMGALDMQLDMMSMLVGSIALGLAVDDTVHFLHNFRRYYHDSGNIALSVSKTLQTTGRAMLFATISLSIGFFVYTQSSLNNLIAFGMITGFAIIMALLADLLLAPALMKLIYQDRPSQD